MGPKKRTSKKTADKVDNEPVKKSRKVKDGESVHDSAKKSSNDSETQNETQNEQSKQQIKPEEIPEISNDSAPKYENSDDDNENTIGNENENENGGSMQVDSTSALGDPSQTLYIQNLNDKINKEDLKRSLYMLFSAYGNVLDVVALKTQKMRGQAHIAFGDVSSAALALRNLQGMNVFGKHMKIAFARSKSNVIAKLDGSYRIPAPPELDPSVLPVAPFERGEY